MHQAATFDVRMGIAALSCAVAWIGCSGAIEPTGAETNPTNSTSAGSSAGGGTAGNGGAQPGEGGSAGESGSGDPGPIIEPSNDAGDAEPGPQMPIPRDAAPRDAAPRDPVVSDASLGDGGYVGPIVAPDCAGDPTAGWTEYADTFHLEFPYDLKPTDRYTFVDGIYTYWIYPTDKPHAVGNTTAPRIETHYTNFKTGTKMWTGDVLVDSPSNSVTIFQVHTGASGAGPVYLQVRSGNLDELNGKQVATGIYDKWFNLKVAFEAATSSATIWVNNCQKLVLTSSRPGDRDFYFKNGVYTCSTPMCRDHYKNIHLYQR